MKGDYAVEAIRRRFAETGSPTRIPLLRQGEFTATLTPEGITVDNLGNQPFLPWAVFKEAINVLVRNNGRANRGDAMGATLGEPDLSLNSIEGHIALVVYGKQPGDTVFRRITPVACILIWANLCEASPRELVLKDV